MGISGAMGIMRRKGGQALDFHVLFRVGARISINWRVRMRCCPINRGYGIGDCVGSFKQIADVKPWASGECGAWNIRSIFGKRNVLK